MTTFRFKKSKDFLSYIKRPEYYFRLNLVFKKIFKSSNGVDQNGIINQKMPWGNKIEIDVNESIGASIYNTRIYDLALSETLWRLIEPGNFVLDIGANIGFVTNLCSYRAGANGTVWAFEPNPLIIKRLTKNIEFNNYQNTKLFPFALSDSNREGFLVLSEMFIGNQGLAFVGSENNNNAIKIELKRLDDLIPGDTEINVLKIDVEGHELSVFKGAQYLINNKLIKNIVFEDHNPYPSETANFLLESGFKIFRIEKGWLSVNLKDPGSTPLISGWESINYLATLEPDKLKKKMKGIFYKCI